MSETSGSEDDDDGLPQPGEVLEHPSGWKLEVTEGDTRRVTRLRLHAPEENSIVE